MVLVRGRNRVPNPAARIIARMGGLTELRDVRGEMSVEYVELGIFLEILFHVSKRARNISKKFRVVFDTGDVDKSSSSFEVALNTGEIENPAKLGHIADEVLGNAIDVSHDEFLDKVLVQLNVRISEK